MPPTKDELQAENDQLKETIAQLEGDRPAAAAARVPKRPDFGLSAGEMDDLRNNGVTTSPFNGEQINALDEGVEPATDQARRNAAAAQKRKRDASGEPTGVSTADVASTQDS